MPTQSFPKKIRCDQVQHTRKSGIKNLRGAKPRCGVEIREGTNNISIRIVKEESGDGPSSKKGSRRGEGSGSCQKLSEE